MTKVFATGTTGYIGGDALYAIAHAHPDYDITCLVRNSDKGAKVAAEYPKIHLVYGDLDSSELIEEESKKADIVCNWASADHVTAVKAILRGLGSHVPSRPGFLIHTSGTGILMFKDLQSRTFGEESKASEKIYDDLEGVSEVTSLPDDAPHRNTDKIVLQAGTENADRVKTAIVGPPAIYGPGRGPDNKRSVQVPELARCILQKGHGIQVNSGKNWWTHVHVHDLSDLYLKLVEEAAAGESTKEWEGKPAVWGAEGYYFTSVEDFIWGEVSKLVATEAKKQGLIKDDSVESISPEEANELSPSGAAMWGTNSRARARRAKVVLNWKPTGPSLKEEVKATVEAEAKTLGIVPGHAKIAAGDV